jgi:epoxyqueuosine reductase
MIIDRIMENDNGGSGTRSRRDFIKTLAIVTPAFFINYKDLLAMNVSNPLLNNSNLSLNFDYKYRTFSVEHIGEVKDWFDKLKGESRISENKIFRSYIDNFVFNPEQIMPGAKSFVIISMPQKVLSLLVNYKNKKYEILIPSGYSDDGVKLADVKDRIMKDIIKDPSKKLFEKVKLPLKTLSVKSGLAEYGKNNITYVDGYGSYHQLIGFYTDKVLDDNWGSLNLLRECKGCSICVEKCPTKCFRENNFVLDIGKCVTLYNELPDPIPDWIDSKSHNAIVGCVKCQWDCPANALANKRTERLAELTEEETEFLLNKGNDEKIKKDLLGKLSSKFPYINDIDYVSRNFKLVFNNLTTS